MKAHQALRAATAPDHDRVDRAFARFALDDPHDYGRFLCAHARALPPVEAALATAGLPFRPRASLLQYDLIELGEAMPPPLSTGSLSDAEAIGALYVVEGSRLGGALLARSVPQGRPCRYLSAAHDPGEWRTTLALIDARLTEDDELIAAAIAAARRVFGLYGEAAALERRG